jgi:DNA-binding NarL/FixJ family response regulator
VIVLVLTVHSDSEHILGILEAGATGYLTKSVFAEEVMECFNVMCFS